MIPNLYKWIQLVTVEELPETPIRLDHCTSITGRKKWLEITQREARDALVKRGPRYKTGALKHELETVYNLMEGVNKW